MLNAYFRFGEQQILRGMMQLDVAMVSKWETKLTVYTADENKWDISVPFIDKHIAFVKPAYDVIRGYKWTVGINSNPIAYSGFGDVDQYRIAFSNWLRIGGMK